MHSNTSENPPARLLSAFFKFGRTPWHNVPADGLSQAETSVLENIQRANRHERVLRVSDLGMILRVSSSTITQHLNNLENQGFVERIHSKVDKRAVNLSLTEKGKEALKSHWKGLEDDFTEFVDIIGEEKAEIMIELLFQAHSFFVEKAKSHENNNIF